MKPPTLAERLAVPWLRLEEGMVGTLAGRRVQVVRVFGSLWLIDNEGSMGSSGSKPSSRSQGLEDFLPDPAHAGTLALIVEQARALYLRLDGAYTVDSDPDAVLADHSGSSWGHLSEACATNSGDPGLRAEHLACALEDLSHWLRVQGSP